MRTRMRSLGPHDSARKVRWAGGVTSHDFPRADPVNPAGADRQPGGAAVAERSDPIPVTTVVIRLPRLVEREPPLPRH